MNVTKAVIINHVQYRKTMVFITAQHALLDKNKAIVARMTSVGIQRTQEELQQLVKKGTVWGDAEIEQAVRTAVVKEARPTKVKRTVVLDGVERSEQTSETTELLTVDVPLFPDITDIIWE